MAWCLLLTGLPNSGKSTIAYHLVQARIRNALIIDGDRHREMQFLGVKHGFSKEDIMANTEHVIKLARFAQDQNINVIISQIAPYLEQREAMAKLDNFYEIFCRCSNVGRSNRPNFKHSDLVYEQGNPDLIINTEINTAEECVKVIRREWLKEKL